MRLGHFPQISIPNVFEVFNFHSSEKVISDNVPHGLSASVEERVFGVLSSPSDWQHFLMLYRG